MWGRMGGLRCAVVMARNAWVSGTIASAIREWAIVSNQQHGAMELPFRTDRGLSTPTRPPRRHGLRRELADTRRAHRPGAQQPGRQAAAEPPSETHACRSTRFRPVFSSLVQMASSTTPPPTLRDDGWVVDEARRRT